MKFLVDAQLPYRLANFLRRAGYDVLHTMDLPMANKTPDSVIESISLDEKRILITKDEDFVNSFTLFKKPYKLLLVSTGNITNTALLSLFENNIADLLKAFEKFDFVELDRDNITFHT